MTRMDHEFNALIEKLNTSRGVNFVAADDVHSKYAAMFNGSVLLGKGTSAELTIAFDQHFPLVLPDIFIDSNELLRAHVGSDGKICLFDQSAILIDQGIPDQVLLDCFDQAVNILQIPIGSKTYYEEICREFASYWSTVADLKVYSCLNSEDITHGEYPLVINKNIYVVGNLKHEPESIITNSFGYPIDKDTFELPCLVLRIRNGSKLLPLSKKYKWNTIRRYVLNNTSASTKRRFRQFLDKKVKRYTGYILLIFPTDSGDILFGFRVAFKNNKYCKIELSQPDSISNVYVERIDFSYLTGRGGAVGTLKDVRILLLGSGSVGGYIANNLCQVGFTKIDILDNDYFRTENVHRHWLGFDSIDNQKMGYKADLIKEKLENHYPYAEIDSLSYVDRSVQSFLSEPNRLGHYDLIISALGEPTLNLEVDRVLKQLTKKVPFICCFNEPYGLGGHVILVNMETNSCLRCLYTDAISSDQVSFKGSFVASGQNFKKNLSGCSSAFVPYSCLDSQQTAILSVRKAVDVLTGIISQNTFFSWVGSPDVFLEHGYLLSDWYHLNAEKSEIRRDDFSNPNCCICDLQIRGDDDGV